MQNCLQGASQPSNIQVPLRPPPPPPPPPPPARTCILALDCVCISVMLAPDLPMMLPAATLGTRNFTCRAVGGGWMRRLGHQRCLTGVPACSRHCQWTGVSCTHHDSLLSPGALAHGLVLIVALVLHGPLVCLLLVPIVLQPVAEQLLGLLLLGLLLLLHSHSSSRLLLLCVLHEPGSVYLKCPGVLVATQWLRRRREGLEVRLTGQHLPNRTIRGVCCIVVSLACECRHQLDTAQSC